MTLPRSTRVLKVKACGAESPSERPDPNRELAYAVEELIDCVEAIERGESDWLRYYDAVRDAKAMLEARGF